MDYDIPADLDVSFDGEPSMHMAVPVGHYAPSQVRQVSYDLASRCLSLSFSIQDFPCQCFTEPGKGKKMPWPGWHSHSVAPPSLEAGLPTSHSGLAPSEQDVLAIPRGCPQPWQQRGQQEMRN